MFPPLSFLFLFLFPSSRRLHFPLFYSIFLLILLPRVLSHLEEGKATLHFYRDKDCREEIHRFTGKVGEEVEDSRAQPFSTFVVHSDRVFYRFNAKEGNENNAFGFFFVVR